MDKKLTFGIFFEVLIKPHTNMNNNESINQIFYGNPNPSNTKYVSSSQGSKIRNVGVPIRSRLYKDYVSLDKSDRIKYIRGLNLYGYSSGTAGIWNSLKNFYIPDLVKDQISKENDVCVCLAELLFFIISSPQNFDPILVSEEKLSASQNKGSFYGNSIDFLKDILKNTKGPFYIDMAFHLGDAYFFSPSYVRILNELLSHDCQIRVLINTGELIKPILAQLRQAGLKYESPERIYSYWVEKMNETNGKLIVKSTHLPLLHKSLISHGENTLSAVLISHYLYGENNPYNIIRNVYYEGSDEYTVSQNEFEYLWNASYDDFRIDETVDIKESPESIKTNPTEILFADVSDENDFFEKCFKYGDISRVCMEFHTGWYWSTERKKIEFLSTLCSNNVPIEVLVNSYESCHMMTQYMRNRLINYPNIDNEIEAWHKKEQMYSTISLRVCRIPLLRRCFFVQFQNGFEICAVKEYHYMTMDDIQFDKVRIYTSDMQEYQVFKSEYEYLWNGIDENGAFSLTYSEFNNPK